MTTTTGLKVLTVWCEHYTLYEVCVTAWLEKVPTNVAQDDAPNHGVISNNIGSNIALFGYTEVISSWEWAMNQTGTNLIIFWILIIRITGRQHINESWILIS